jgi:Glycosyl hydrolase family 26
MSVLPRLLRRRVAGPWLAAGVAAAVMGLWSALPSAPAATPAERSVSSDAAVRTVASSYHSKGRQARKTLYWGAWIGSGLTGTAAPWDMGAVTAFQRMVRKPLSLVEWSIPFANCESSPCDFYEFPLQHMGDVRSYGAIPFLSWGSQSIPVDPNRPADLPDFQLSDLIAGRYDAYIRDFAIAARNWGHPFFLRFNWEMNGTWFPWAIKANGNTAAQYRPAWRHVHDIFTSVGATNATWVWCPYVDIRKKFNLKTLYPGSRYVDWTCLDGYNWGRGNPAQSQPWRSFSEIYGSTYRRVVRSIAPRKPMILAELATSDYGGNKAAWIRDMLATVARAYPKVRGIIYFNENDRNAHWEIESSPAVIQAFRDGIRRAAFVGNKYAGIESRPIRPPARR